MKHDNVESTMTSDVVRAAYDTPFEEIARLLSRHQISGLPVVDDDEKVIGVISTTDLMVHRSGEEDIHRGFNWSMLTSRARVRESKAQARNAGQLMTHPAVTVPADQSIAAAARIMAEHRIERLPVVDDDDRLVGIVTRRDLLQVFLRPDAEIRREVIDEVLVRALWLPPEAVRVDVRDGVVTLTGQLPRRSDVPVALRMARQIDGVIAVVDELTFSVTDSRSGMSEEEFYGDGGRRRTL